MNELLAKIAEILEVANVVPELKFREVDDWDSLKGFAIIVMIARDYGKEMSVAEFMSCNQVQDLMNFVEGK